MTAERADGLQAVSDAELERQIRQGRKFTAEEAIGRLAGPGAMKGGSVISRQHQAGNAIGVWLAASIDDPAGALKAVLHRYLKGSNLLLEHVDEPLAAAVACFRQILGSEHRLREIVREADVEWGRMMDERPRFDREANSPDPDDPYTAESVRKSLSDALQGMSH